MTMTISGIAAFGTFLPATTVLGYLDPGTGSYALQLLLAGAFGGLFALKQSWQQCRIWLEQGPLGRLLPAAGVKPLDR